jgi:hypothetical protein
MFILLPLLNITYNTINKKQLVKYSYLIIVLVLMFTQWTPTYSLVKETSKEAKGIRIDKKIASENIKNYVNKKDKVFIVIQKDKGLNFHWMRYELLPNPTNGGYWSFGDDGGWNYAWKPKHLKNFMIKAKYSYLYLHKTDETFNKRFIDLFGGITPQSKTLYKFDAESHISFTKVD